MRERVPAGFPAGTEMPVFPVRMLTDASTVVSLHVSCLGLLMRQVKTCSTNAGTFIP